MANNIDGLMNKFEAAECLNVSVRTVERLIERGLMPVVKVGRCVRIPALAIREYIDQSLYREIATTPIPRIAGRAPGRAPASVSSTEKLDDLLAAQTGGKRKHRPT